MQGGNRGVCPHNCLDLNGNVHVPIASTGGGTEVQSCKADSEGALDVSGIRLQEAQHCVTQSRSLTSSKGGSSAFIQISEDNHLYFNMHHSFKVVEIMHISSTLY